MKKCEFSEKLFESLLNREILNKLFKNHCTPELYSPSQTDESKKGYDAHFKGVSKRCFAIQYKLSSQYERKNKKAKIKKNDFKIQIYKSKTNGYNQHNQLVKQNRSKKIIAFYCAPKFTTLKELQKYAKDEKLTSNCIWSIPKDSLPKWDKESHMILHRKNFTQMRSMNHYLVETIDFDAFFGLGNNRSDILLEPLEAETLKKIIYDEIDISEDLYFIIY